MTRNILLPIAMVFIVAGSVQGDPPGRVDRASFQLYLLAGQSNMAGRGAVSEQDKRVHPRVFVLNRKNQWEPARDPLHFDKPSIVGVGPGLAFGKAMAEADPNVIIGLIPCAVGGSPISAWKPHSYYQAVNVYPYDDAVARCRVATQRGVLKGILWHQGESDSNATDGPQHAYRLTEVISQFRHDLEVPDLLFVAGTFADAYTARVPESKLVIDAIKAVAEADANVSWVSGSGLPCKDDRVHFNAEGARELGRRYAEAVCEYRKRSP
jgi:hypothetical protein